MAKRNPKGTYDGVLPLAGEPRSINDALAAAFAAVRASGIVALHDVSSLAQGWEDAAQLAETTEPKPRGAVFWHGQDKERALREGLQLTFGAIVADRESPEADALARPIGIEVARALAVAGVPFAWDGTTAQRITVLPFAWNVMLSEAKRVDALRRAVAAYVALDGVHLDVFTALAREGASCAADVDALIGRKPPADVLFAGLAVTRDANTFKKLLAAVDVIPTSVFLNMAATRRDDDVESVRAIVARCTDPKLRDTRDAQGRTALHFAAERGDSSWVTVLLEAGFDPNARDARDKTPRDLSFAGTSLGHGRVRRMLDALTAPPPPPAAPPAGPEGKRVGHPKFGEGTILKSDGEKLTVKFDDGAERTLLARVLAPV